MMLLEVSKDYFLFSCFEFEKTCKAIPHKLVANRRWPLGRELYENRDAAATGGADFAQLIQNMLDWYIDAYPKLREVEKIDDSSLVEIVEPLVYMGMDLQLLSQAKFDSKLPSLQLNQITGPWQDIASQFERKLPALRPRFMEYMEWTHQAAPILEEDEGDRPPIGRYSPSFGRRPAGGRPERDDRPRRGDDRGRRDDRGPRGGDRGPRGERGKRDDRGGREQRGPRPHREPRERKEPILEPAQIEEISQAVAELKGNPQLEEIKLAPTNSFYRHLQHTKIKEEGFFSRSEGEGPDRSVVITRRPGMEAN